MKKQIIISLTTALVISLYLVSGTLAYYNDFEVSPANVFTAGTLDLLVNDNNGQIGATIQLDNICPCQNEYVVINLKNAGSQPIDIWKKIMNIQVNENGITEPEQAYYNEYFLTEKNDIHTLTLYSMWIDNDGDTTNCDIINGDIWVVQESQNYYLDDIENNHLYLGRLNPGQIFIIVQGYHLECITDNWAQSDQISFDIEFYAEQIACTPEQPTPSKIPAFPTYQITAKFDYPGINSYWDIILSGITGEPYDVSNGLWTGWCVDQSHFINNHATHTITLFSSYDTSLPTRIQNQDWPKVNWIINHKPPGMTKTQIQDAIWEFIDGGYHGTNADVLKLISDANTYGSEFVPLQNQLMAVVCWIDNSHQATFIEVDP